MELERRKGVFFDMRVIMMGDGCLLDIKWAFWMADGF